jgi:hypothetical protein
VLIQLAMLTGNTFLIDLARMLIRGRIETVHTALRRYAILAAPAKWSYRERGTSAKSSNVKQSRPA